MGGNEQRKYWGADDDLTAEDHLFMMGYLIT